MLVEVCANSLESAICAEKAGADRIELCSELGVGGITPSYGLLKSVKEQLSIPVHVLIRPRSGDFTYSDAEFEIMKRNIRLCTEMGFDGIVSGVLHRDLHLDVERTQMLVDLAGSLQFTFHRAFDWVKDPLTVFRQLEQMGVNAVLSSGQQSSAEEGIKLLSDLHQMSSTCTVLPGGGIRLHNAVKFKIKEFKAIHLSGTVFRQTLDKQPKIPMNTPSFLKEDEIPVTDIEIIRQIVQVVNN